MPIQEAKSCGVPTVVMNYTAMREKGRIPDYKHLKDVKDYSCHKGGDIIEVDRYYYEPETSCKRALPSIDDLAKKMRDLICDQERLETMKKDARQCVEDNYDWDKLYKRWEFVLDKVKPKERTGTWDTPIVINEKPTQQTFPDGMSDEQFVEWLYINVMKYPRVDEQGAKMWVDHLKRGVTKEQLHEQFLKLAGNEINDGNAREEVRAKVAKRKGEEVQHAADHEWI